MKEEEIFDDSKKPKNENFDEYRCDICNNPYPTEIEFQKHKSVHSSSIKAVKIESMNGIIEIDDDSSSDDENDISSNRSYDENSYFKKEDELSDKIRVDNNNPRSDDANEVNNSFTNDSRKDGFQFAFSSNDDSRENFLETNSMEASKSPYDSRSSNDDTTSRSEHTTIEAGENMEEDDTSDHNNSINAELADDDDIADEDVGRSIEQHDINSCDTLLNSSEENTCRNETTDNVDSSGKDNEDIQADDQNDAQVTSKISDELNKEPDKDDDTECTDNKRPSSRESIASSASSSSERTLTIRSASQVNKTVSSSSDVVVKSESSADKIDKPGISVLNPSQLGINVVPNTSFTPPAEPQINYMSSGLPNGSNPFQCDVCETTFADSIVLEDHKANSGHYRCHYSSECATYVFPNMTELSQHQQTYHGVMSQSPVQQLQHQVQNLPVRYQLDQQASLNYQSIPQYPQTSVSPARNNIPSSMYPSPQNKLSSRQNPNNNLRIQYSSVRGQVTMANPTNHAMKRGPAGPSPRMMSAKRRWNGDVDCRVISVQKPDNNDDVVAQLSKSITITTRQESQKKNETAAVANMLATRGITVSQVPAKSDANSNALTMLNLNSAVSLIPTNKTSNFAIPQGRVGANRPVLGTPSNRMQTVDLTGPEASRNRSLSRSGTNRFTCQICDRTFFNSEQLNQHILTHRSSTSRKQLPYRCGSCGAQYPNQQSLSHHKQTCKIGVTTSTNEMVIPVVDLKQPGALHKLQSNGFNYVIPVNAMGSQSSNGTFGIPILPLSSGSGLLNITNCGISNVLPIGPLKTLGHFGR